MIPLILKISWKMRRRIPYKIPRLGKKLLPIIVSDLTVRQISICYFVYTELVMCHNPDLDSASDWMKQISKQSEVFPDLDSGKTSVWNFCTCFSDVLSRRNHYTCQLSRLRRESHACGFKTSISRRLTLAGQFLMPD